MVKLTWLEPIILLSQNFGLSSQELKEAENLGTLHEQEIRNAWFKHFPG